MSIISEAKKFIIDQQVDNGLGKYIDTINNLNKVDVSSNAAYQDNYRSYYGMNRTTTKDFQKQYFKYLENNKNNKNLTYRQVLADLYTTTGRVDYSFASKLLHTINQGNPILDQHVMRLLGFYLKTTRTVQDRIDYYVNVHETVKGEYAKIANGTYNGRDIYNAIKSFNKQFDQYANINLTKKIDCIIFRMKSERATSILGI